MVSSIFIDTDVIIDLLIDRKPFANAAVRLFDLAEKKKLKISTSSISLNNVHYICRKVIGDRKTRLVLSELLEILEVLPVTQSDIQNAIESDFKDFEDAIQHSVATSNKSIKSIITRNTKDYKSSKIAIFSSDDFVKMILKQS